MRAVVENHPDRPHHFPGDLAFQIEFELVLEFGDKLREITAQVAADEVVQPLVGVLAANLRPADVADDDLVIGPLEHLRAQ